MRKKKTMNRLLSLALCLSAPVSSMLLCTEPLLAQETAPAEVELPDVSDKKPNGQWGTANYYLLEDGTLYFGPGKTTATPKKFYLASYVTRIVSHPDFDTSALTSMYEMFNNYEKLEDISGLATWDISNVTTMYGAFSNSKIRNVDALSSWYSEKLWGINSMFYNCTELTDISGLAKLGQGGLLRDMNGTFNGCSSLTSLDGLQNWTGHLDSLDSMSSTFDGCTSLKDISALAEWKTPNLTNLCQTFNSCPISDLSAFTDWDVSKVSGFSGTFTNNEMLISLHGLENWNTQSATGYSQMFENCTKLVDVNAMKNWTTTKWFTADNILNNTAVSRLDLSGWNTAQMFFSDQSSSLFSKPLTSIKLSSSYMAMIRPNKQALIRSKDSDSYGDSWVSAKLHGPYTSAELTDGTVTWDEEMDGWWGRAKPAVLQDDEHGMKADIYLPAGVETALPLNVEGFDGSPFHSKLIGWKKDGSDEMITSYSAALDEENIVLHPVWEIEDATTVWSFDANGGTGSIDDISINSKETETKTIPDCAFTREDYRFTGWNTAADGSGETMQAGDALQVDFDQEARTLYAQWEKIPSHTVTFDSNGGTGSMEALNWKGEEAKTLTKNVFIRTDYEFTGWNTAADGSGTAYADEAVIEGSDSDQTITLYAQWKKIPSHTVTFNANGGTGSMETLSWKGEASNSLPENAFSRKWYIFTGWNTAADGSGTAYANLAEVPGGNEDSSLTLYAQWELHLNYDLLNTAIAKGESLKGKTFSGTGNEDLQSALSTAAAVRESALSQDAVDDAALALNQALLNLRLTVDNPLP